MTNTRIPKLVGGFGEYNFGVQYRQGKVIVLREIVRVVWFTL